MRKILFYSAALLYSISTQNFASDKMQLEQIQSDAQAIKKTNIELATVNQLFKHCQMELNCIETGLRLLADQQNQVAATMLEELRKKHSQNPKTLEICYLKEKEAVNKQLLRCNIKSDATASLPYNDCIVEKLGKLGLKGNLLAQMQLLQILRKRKKLDDYKVWQDKFDKISKTSSCR